MKKHVLMLMVLLTGVTVGASDNSISLIKRLEDKGEYRLAAEMLVENLNNSQSKQTFRELLDFSNRILAKLSIEITRKEISIFSPPDKDGIWDRSKANKGLAAAAVLADFFGGYGIFTIAHQAWLNKKATDKQRSAVEKVEIPLLSVDKVQQVLNAYDSIKIVVICLERKCLAEIKKNSDDLDSMLKILNEIRNLKKRLKADRTNFLSYNVISPYLWETERLIFLADSDYLTLTFKNKQVLDNAVKFLAKACHKEWLYQANEDVRMQFTGTQRALKQVASKTELDDYKVVTTLLDSIDPSKKRGADAWMK